MKQLPALLRIVAVSSSVTLLNAGSVAETDPFAALATESRPLATRWQSDYRGALQVGLGYTSDDNFMFGQYNGLQEEGATLIGNLQWNNFRNADSSWQASVSDLGLDTREGELVWRMRDKLRISIALDSQQQAGNNSGSTPFRGSDTLVLPQDWVSGINTNHWSALDTSLRPVKRELERQRYSLGLEYQVNHQWRLESHLLYEDKHGTTDTAGGIYVDASSADAAMLPAPVDYRNTELDIAVQYSGKKLHLDGRIEHADFDNKDTVLEWQNPYSSYGPNVRYPIGSGGLGQAPDNQQSSARLTAQYIFSASTRLQVDGSYALASQDQGYLDYSVNQTLTIEEPLPRSDYGADVATSTMNTKLLMRPFKKVSAEIFYRLRDRNYDAPRDGYRYIPGDGGSQSRAALTVYNTSHDLLTQTVGFDVGYRLPLRSKLNFEYQFEDAQRRNAAVEETQESRATLRYRIQPWSDLNVRLELLAADRAADTYHWDQAYYARLDTQLINATPQSQRYSNHPQLSQYYLSNREQWQGKADLNYLLGDNWSLNLNLLWREDDFDKSELGLTDSQWQRVHLSASYTLSAELSGSLYGGTDYYEAQQSSRTFRGGQEKNAFAVYPPLPQASDPGRNWELVSENNSYTLGANLQWQLHKDLEISLDYSFVDTLGEQNFDTWGAADVDPQDLPDVDTTLHHLEATGTWHLYDNLSLKLDYQYYRYVSNDWAWQDLQASTLDKVLSFGERNPNEQIHYMGVSAIYRWQ